MIIFLGKVFLVSTIIIRGWIYSQGKDGSEYWVDGGGRGYGGRGGKCE